MAVPRQRHDSDFTDSDLINFRRAGNALPDDFADLTITDAGDDAEIIWRKGEPTPTLIGAGHGSIMADDFIFGRSQAVSRSEQDKKPRSGFLHFEGRRRT